MSKYLELRKVDVSKQIEKKNNLSYLSWAWAVDILLQEDATATWEYAEPKMFGETMMVFCTVHAFGKSMTAQLPVMDFRNKAIPNPDSFAVNTAMQRCLAKAIALHGLGLYIYAGEDLPEAEVKKVSDARIKELIDQINGLEGDAKKNAYKFAMNECSAAGDLDAARKIKEGVSK